MTTLKKAMCASTLAAGIGLAGLLGTGIGTASADPGPGCNAPGRPPCGPGFHDDRSFDDRGGRGPDWHDDRGFDDRGGPGPDWHGRGIDDGRRDHQPFDWNGQQVNPVLGADGQGWGFWFLGAWIPL